MASLCPIIRAVSNSAPASSTTCTVTKPAGTLDGDILYVHVKLNGSYTTLTPPSGWTLLHSQGLGTGKEARSYWKAASSEGSSYTWTTDTSITWAAGMISIIGGDTSALDAEVGSTDSSSTTTATCAGLTTTVDNTLVILSVVNGGGAATTPNANMAEYSDSSSVEIQWEERPTAGATGTRDSTLSTSQRYHTQILAVKPLGKPYVHHVATTAPGVGTSFVGNKPSGTRDGDLLFAAIMMPNGVTADPTPPSGWTLIRRVASGVVSMATYYKIAASEGSTWTWTLDTSNTGGAVQVAACSGVYTTSPLDVEAGQANASSSSATAPGVTTTAADDLLIAAFTRGNSATSFTPPTGMDEYTDVTNTSLASTRAASAAATGDKTAALSNSGTSSGMLAAFFKHYVPAAGVSSYQNTLLLGSM